MRVLVLASYPRSCAATRFRIAQFGPLLAKRGIELDLDSFVSEAFFESFYKPGRRLYKGGYLAARSLARLVSSLTTGPYDAVFVQREAALVGPAYAERLWSSLRGVPTIFDFDDAIWHLDLERARHPFFASMLKRPNKCWDTMARANQVIAGSAYLAERATAHNTQVTMLPTVVDKTMWVPLSGRARGEHLHAVPRIGWVGSHSTAHQLELVAPALRRLSQERRPFELVVVGAADEFVIDGLTISKRPWTLQTEISEFGAIDIGLAPLHDAPVYQGKCGFKQVQFMAMGVPTVSSWVGGAKDFVVDGHNALVARTEDDWYVHLSRLLDDQALRAQLSEQGRNTVERDYCTQAVAPKLADVIVSTVESRR